MARPVRFPDDVPVLALGDVTLRPPHLADLAHVVEQSVDRDSVRWTGVPSAYGEGDALAFLAHDVPRGWAEDREYTFAVEATHPDGVRRFSGTVGLEPMLHRRAELGFGVHPAARGRGVATAAARLAVAWAFESLGAEAVLWQGHRGNLASRRVAWRLGFGFADGFVPRWLPQRGEYRDAWVGSLHRDDAREPRTPWLELPRLDGDGLVLRGFLDSDAPRLSETHQDAATRQMLPFLATPGWGDAAASVLRWTEMRVSGTGGLIWAVTDGDRWLGYAGIPRLTRGGPEIGYAVHPDARGSGVASRAVRAVVRHCLSSEGLDAHRVFLTTAATNRASQRVAEACGFTQYGVERSSVTLGDGTTDDLVLYELLRGG